jgi:hypothetical protein
MWSHARRGIRDLTPHFRTVQTQFAPASCGTNWKRQEIAHAHEVVSRCREGEHPSDLQDSAVAHFAHQCDGLQPTEALFNPFPLLLADRVAIVTRSIGKRFVDG